MERASSTRQGLTVRLSPEAQERVRLICAAEHRSVAAYLEALVERDLQARSRAEQVVRVFVDPDLGGIPLGDVAREGDEDGERHAGRTAALRKLFGAGR